MEVSHRRRNGQATRLVIVAIDTLAWIVSAVIAGILRFEFAFDSVPLVPLIGAGVTLGVAGTLAGLANHLYRNRYVVGSLDEFRALVGVAAAVSILLGAVFVLFGNEFGVPRSLVFLAAPLFILVSGTVRIGFRLSKVPVSTGAEAIRRALVYGAGDAAEALIPQLLASKSQAIHPVALIDDSPEKNNRWIRGVPMGGSWQQLPAIVDRFSPNLVIVAIPSADSALLTRVYSDASKLGLQVVVLPTLQEYLERGFSAGELRDVSIEDLLGRRSVELDAEPISKMIMGKRVLVTGAGGSIGSELVKQIGRFEPQSLVLVDRDETALLLASIGLKSVNSRLDFETYLVDIRDRPSVSELFSSRRPDVVFHAAALKHLTMLENFPREAWKTNVEGTQNVLEAASDSGVTVFVNISTDKAANPTSTLGRSKLIGEDLTAWFGVSSEKPYVSVRFGNVLGSRGSLIPVLSQQIANGGPVSLTDKRATRYFMSIPEACQLVLQAAAQGEAEDVFVLDMGAPVRIQEVAERMIQLSGRQIDIEYIGLRPGEKIDEELVAAGEVFQPSSHPKIMRLKARPRSPSEVQVERW